MSCTCLCRIVLLVFLLGLHSAFSAQFYNDWAAVHFNDIPAQSGSTNDPDGDGELNAVEFALGTDPRAAGGLAGIVKPLYGPIDGTNGTFTVELLECEGHQPGVQIDLYLSKDLQTWFRPWWQRSVTNSQPADPVGSVRESFSTCMPGTNMWFIRVAVKLFEAGPAAANFYVATNGNDSFLGNINQPFKTLGKAVSVATPGNLIYLRGGTYTNSTKVQITSARSGTPANPIRLRAYPGETPILNFSAQTTSTVNRGIEISGRWWNIYGLEIFGCGDNGINISGHSNVIERCVFHDCRDTGLQISAPGSSNLVLNCDSYHNFDPDPVNPGEDADGFAPKLAGLGPNNVFRGCRAWENADDGWDLFGAPNVVILENCWTWGNGANVLNVTNYSGDGNGFKLGGTENGVLSAAPHRVLNCVSFNNTHHGFDQNNNAAGQTLDNCTAWNNGLKSGHNINLNHGAVTQGVHLVRNCLSIAGSVSFFPGTIQTSNSWQLLPMPGATVNDVLSLDETFALAPRRDDGSLPEVPFLRPVPTGRLVNLGTDVGIVFSGVAPDLGAFETSEW